MSVQLNLLKFPPSIMSSPKQHAISVSRKPHVRIEVVAYEPRKRNDGSDYLCHHGWRVDVSIREFTRIVRAAPASSARSELLNALALAKRPE